MNPEASPEGLIDTHSHLMLPEFQGDMEEVLLRAKQAGVRRIVLPGLDLETSQKAVELAVRWPSLYAAVGIHPNRAGQWQAARSLKVLRSLASSPRVVAIGEIGLDYFRKHAEPDIQRHAFEAQLELAAELDLPVILHNRDSTHDLLEIILRWAERCNGRREGVRGVLHAFSADYPTAQLATQAGFYVGIAGPLTYPKSADLRSLAARVPRDRLLLETDAPYLTPVPHRGTRNEPSYLPWTARSLSQALGLEDHEVAATTSQNASRLFGWDDGTDHRNLL